MLSYQNNYLHSPATQAVSLTELTLLPQYLLPFSRPKDPPPLPCEDPGDRSLGGWLLAVEDAQAGVQSSVCVLPCVCPLLRVAKRRLLDLHLRSMLPGKSHRHNQLV